MGAGIAWKVVEVTGIYISDQSEGQYSTLTNNVSSSEMLKDWDGYSGKAISENDIQYMLSGLLKVLGVQSTAYSFFFLFQLPLLINASICTITIVFKLERCWIISKARVVVGKFYYIQWEIWLGNQNICSSKQTNNSKQTLCWYVLTGADDVANKSKKLSQNHRKLRDWNGL